MNTNVTQQSEMNDPIVANRWSFWLIALALVAGLVLSIMSALNICVEHCSATNNYRFFGLPLSYPGLAFFIVAIILHFSSPRFEKMRELLGYMIGMAFGAEVMLIALQKYQIGKWCPVCLGIAFCIGITGVTLFYIYLQDLSNTVNLKQRGQIMNLIKKGFSSLSLMFLGFLMAFVGVSKFDYAQAAMNQIQNEIALGNHNSDINVYFVTDWFCPACRQVEPIVEKVFPKIQSKVKFYFVDFPIHAKSLNFTPYNLAFLIQDKAQYLTARRELTKLAERKEAPTDQDITAIARGHHLKFNELTYVEAKPGIDFFEEIVKKFDLHSTPMLIIENTKTHKVVKLDGRDEIKENKILETIESLQKS